MRPSFLQSFGHQLISFVYCSSIPSLSPFIDPLVQYSSSIHSFSHPTHLLLSFFFYLFTMTKNQDLNRYLTIISITFIRCKRAVQLISSDDPYRMSFLDVFSKSQITWKLYNICKIKVCCSYDYTITNQHSDCLILLYTALILYTAYHIPIPSNTPSLNLL